MIKSHQAISYLLPPVLGQQTHSQSIALPVPKASLSKVPSHLSPLCILIFGGHIAAFDGRIHFRQKIRLQQHWLMITLFQNSQIIKVEVLFPEGASQ